MFFEEGSVSAGIVSGLVEFATVRGANRDDLLDEVDMDELELRDPDGRVELGRYVTLFRAAQSMTGDPALALHFGEEIGMSKVSIVGLVMEASRTMGEAFVQLQRFGRLATDVPDAAYSPRFELVNERGKLFMVDRRRDPNSIPELTELAFASLVCGPRRFLSQPHVISVDLTHSAPAYEVEYQRVFRCPVRFGTRWNAMELHPHVTEWEVAKTPRYLFGVLANHADGLLKEMDSRRTLQGRIESLLLPKLHEGEANVDAVAAHLGFSRQTLFRKLREEGTTFSGVLDQLRRRVAESYLSGGSASVKETAYLVGFSDSASFSRAFKRWTGKSPTEFREEQAK